MITDTRGELAKRNYAAVTVEQTEAGWAVHLDRQALTSPRGVAIVAPTQELAARLAREWDEQGEWIVPAAMPVMRLVSVALDHTPARREALIQELTRYLETDLVCHVDDDDAALRARQDEVWGPLRAWARQAEGLELKLASGVIAVTQPEATFTRTASLAAELDDVHLTALAHAAGLLGSTVLALALLRGHITSQEAFAASRLDESYQEERWGVDEEAAARAAGLAREVEAVAAVLEALSA